MPDGLALKYLQALNSAYDKPKPMTPAKHLAWYLAKLMSCLEHKPETVTSPDRTTRGVYEIVDSSPIGHPRGNLLQRFTAMRQHT